MIRYSLLGIKLAPPLKLKSNFVYKVKGGASSDTFKLICTWKFLGGPSTSTFFSPYDPLPLSTEAAVFFHFDQQVKISVTE